MLSLPLPNHLRKRFLCVALPLLCGFTIATAFFLMARDRDLWLLGNRLVRFIAWPVFGDLSLTLQHLHEADRGRDLLADPASQFAYPRAILVLRHLGLQRIPSEWLGLLQGVLFTATVVFVLRPFTLQRAVGTAALLLTPAMLLGFERGNLDYPLFTICTAAAWLWSRCSESQKPRLAVSALASAAVLKLYPIFALIAAAIAENSRRRLYWVIGASGLCVYFYAIRSDLEFVRQKVPIATTSSWGSLVSFARLEDHFSAESASWLATIDWSLVALATYGAVIVVALLIGKRLTARFAALQWRADEWCYYWVGAGICCGCFAAANFVYRWAFALLTLPLLLRAARSPDRLLAFWARTGIGAVAVGFVAKLSLTTVPFALVQLANWLFIFTLIVGASALHLSTARREEPAVAPSEDPVEDDASPVPASAAQT